LPLYEFVCDKCKEAANVLRKYDDQYPPEGDEASAKCPKRGKHKWTKKIHAPNVSFGGGWSPTGQGGKGNW
jgi:putative FmdB family regulatory protein